MRKSSLFQSQVLFFNGFEKSFHFYGHLNYISVKFQHFWIFKFFASLFVIDFHSRSGYHCFGQRCIRIMPKRIMRFIQSSLFNRSGIFAADCWSNTMSLSDSKEFIRIHLQRHLYVTFISVYEDCSDELKQIKNIAQYRMIILTQIELNTPPSCSVLRVCDIM